MERRIYERPRAELLAVAVEEGIAVSSPESVSGTHEDVTLDGGTNIDGHQHIPGHEKKIIHCIVGRAPAGGVCKEAPSGGRQPEPGEGAIRAVAEEVHDGAVSRSSFDENGRVAWSQAT